MAKLRLEADNEILEVIADDMSAIREAMGYLAAQNGPQVMESRSAPNCPDIFGSCRQAKITDPFLEMELLIQPKAIAS